ncbi:MAG: AAA family ATPase [Candidatus Latescibacteria bacterium]|nr:AAA family ATPase [Candidatus Latescibacterota bacterium]
MALSSQYLIDIALDREDVDSFDVYPFNLSAVKHLQRLPLHPEVTFIIGENGAGKSTLLEAIAVAWGFNAEGGSLSFRFDTRASHSALHQHLRLSRGVQRPRTGYFLRAESFFNVATQIEKLDEDFPNIAKIGPAYGKRALHEQSHGESFLALLTERFQGRGFYILDEPEAALSPNRQLTVLARLRQLVAAGSQFLIATHSPLIMAYPGARIYQLGEGGIREVEYQATEHYAVTKAFLNNPQKMLDVLMEE